MGQKNEKVDCGWDESERGKVNGTERSQQVQRQLIDSSGKGLFTSMAMESECKLAIGQPIMVVNDSGHRSRYNTASSPMERHTKRSSSMVDRPYVQWPSP